MKKLFFSLILFNCLAADIHEYPCILVFDTDNHRMYLKLNGHEADIFDMNHSNYCPCLIQLDKSLYDVLAD